MGRDSRARHHETPRAPKPTRLSDAQLEQIAQDTARMDKSTRIAFWDKRQAKNVYGGDLYTPGVVLCPNDATHGALQMAGSGVVLICQQRAPGDRNTFCSGSMPVSL